jgi:acetyl-CoA C-acetyltransferase
VPEAVIVATARTPIGRAFKGSLKDLRADDLAAFIIKAALEKVPQLDPEDFDDLMLGCGLPGGEQGFNMARVVAVLLGYDHLPGVTLTRYCSSSLQTTRMAFHAIKAGEGDVFISAGVEMVSRYVNGNGGAIAVGHPFGMTGARITTTLINSLQFHDKQIGLETMCVGGGQGMALVLERLS